MRQVDIIGYGAVVAAVALGLAISFFLRARQRRELEAFEYAASWLATSLPVQRLAPMTARAVLAREDRQWIVELGRGGNVLPWLALRTHLVFNPSSRPGREPRFDAEGDVFEGPAALRLRRRTLADKIAEALGLTRRLRAGDTGLDLGLVIESEAAAPVIAAFFAERAAVEAIKTLFTAGASHVDVLMGTEAIAVGFRRPTSYAVSRVPHMGQLLDAVADAVPAVKGDPVSRGRGIGLAWLPLGWAILAAVGVLASVLGADSHPILDTGARPSLFRVAMIVALVGIAASYVVCRGRNRGGSRFAVSALTAVAACYFSVNGGGQLLNRVLDASEPTAHETEVIDLEERERRSLGAKSTEYDLTLDDWRHPGSEVHVAYGSRPSPDLAPGRPAIVKTRKGRFGWEWVSSVEPVVRPSSSAR